MTFGLKPNLSCPISAFALLRATEASKPPSQDVFIFQAKTQESIAGKTYFDAVFVKDIILLYSLVKNDDVAARR